MQHCCHMTLTVWSMEPGKASNQTCTMQSPVSQSFKSLVHMGATIPQQNWHTSLQLFVEEQMLNWLTLKIPPSGCCLIYSLQCEMIIHRLSSHYIWSNVQPRCFHQSTVNSSFQPAVRTLNSLHNTTLIWHFMLHFTLKSGLAWMGNAQQRLLTSGKIRIILAAA